MSEPKPEYPDEAGVEEELPDVMQVEGAELLANEARPQLRALGFTDEEIDEWALTYIAMEGSGDVDSFIDWITQEELAHGAG
jgi:hypothetical protein